MLFPIRETTLYFTHIKIEEISHLSAEQYQLLTVAGSSTFRTLESPYYKAIDTCGVGG